MCLIQWCRSVKQREECESVTFLATHWDNVFTVGLIAEKTIVSCTKNITYLDTRVTGISSRRNKRYKNNTYQGRECQRYTYSVAIRAAASGSTSTTHTWEPGEKVTGRSPAAAAAAPVQHIPRERVTGGSPLECVW